MGDKHYLSALLTVSYKPPESIIRGVRDPKPGTFYDTTLCKSYNQEASPLEPCARVLPVVLAATSCNFPACREGKHTYYPGVSARAAVLS